MRIIKLIWSIAVLSAANVNTIISDSNHELANNESSIPTVPTYEQASNDLDAKILRNAANIDNLANIYTIQGGKNRTALHHKVNSQDHQLALIFIQEIIRNGGKIEAAFPKEKLVLEYVFFTDEGTPQYSEHLLMLVQFLLRYTKTSRPKEKGGTLTALEVGIKAMAHPRILQSILLQSNFPVNYDPRYSCSPLSMLMLSKFKSEYTIEDAIQIFWEAATNFTEIAPCQWLDPQKKITALNAICLLEPYEPIDEFREITIRKAKSLMKFGAHPLQRDDFGDPFENAVLTDKSYLKEVMMSFPKRDKLDVSVLELRYFTLHIVRTFKWLYSALKSSPVLVLIFISSILYLWYNYYSIQKKDNQHKKLISNLKKKSEKKLVPPTSTTPVKESPSDKEALRKKSKNIMISQILPHDHDSKKIEEETKPLSSAPIQNSLAELLNTTYTDNDIKTALTNYYQKKLLNLNSSWGEQNDTLLMHLIRKGYLNSVYFVISKIVAEQPTLINEINDQDQTALMVACLTNQPIIINYLFNVAFNLYTNLRDKNGDNALSIWLSSPSKQKLACAKKLVGRGCEITPTVRRVWDLALNSNQQEELEKYADECERSSFEDPKNRRRKSLKTEEEIEKKDTSIKEKSRKRSLHTDFSPVQQLRTEESKSSGRIQFQHNLRLSYLCIRNCNYLIASFNKKQTTPLEKFCRHATLLVHLLDLAIKIAHYTKSNHLNTEKPVSLDFIHCIGHSVIPPLLKPSFKSAISDVEQMASQFVQWIPNSLKEKKLEEKLSLSKKEAQDASTLLGFLINFFEEKNESGLRLKESDLFKTITSFHNNISGTEFAAAKQEEYVKFALPIISEIYDIYKTMLKHQHVLVLLLCSCGDSWVKYGNVNQSEAFSSFVAACRISLRNRLTHDPNFSFLKVTPAEIHYLCQLAEKAREAQGLPGRVDWHKTFYSKEIVSTLEKFGLFSRNPRSDDNKVTRLIFEYADYIASTESTRKCE